MDSSCNNRHYVVRSKHFVETLPTLQILAKPCLHIIIIRYQLHGKRTILIQAGQIQHTSNSMISYPTKLFTSLNVSQPPTKQICYPKVKGELYIPQTDINNNNGIQTASLKNLHVNR